jgi:DNA-binding response OmpR family regulator
MRTKGFKTLQAPEGKTGLKLLESQKPDVILLDIELPDMDVFGKK